MGNYVPKKQCKIEFDGDQITFELDALLDQDFGKLLPFFKQNEAGETILAFEDQVKFNSVASGLLKKYVTNFTGCVAADGSQVVLETVLNTTYFMELKSKMAAEMFAFTQIGGGDSKNSDGQPVPGSKG